MLIEHKLRKVFINSLAFKKTFYGVWDWESLTSIRKLTKIDVAEVFLGILLR